MLIKLFYINKNENEEVKIQKAPLEIVNDNIYMRVDTRMTLDENENLITEKDGSLQLKFETPYNQPINMNTRIALYQLYKELTINQKQIAELHIYDDDELLLFSSKDLGMIPGTPFIVDTAINMDQNNDKYIGVTIPLLWEVD